MSQETQAARWIGFRQPVLRVAARAVASGSRSLTSANPGEVGERGRVLDRVVWRIDPDGRLGIRYTSVRLSAGEKLTVGGLLPLDLRETASPASRAAAKEGLTPLQYMRPVRPFLVEDRALWRPRGPVRPATWRGQAWTRLARPSQGGRVRGVEVDGQALAGSRPRRKPRVLFPILADWEVGELAGPTYSRATSTGPTSPGGGGVRPGAHVSAADPDPHPLGMPSTDEISHSNPVWMHTGEPGGWPGQRRPRQGGTRRIGYFVNRVWVTGGHQARGIACSHHLGRWRLHPETGGGRCHALAELSHRRPPAPAALPGGCAAVPEPGSGLRRIWWTMPGWHQNLTFSVHPDPVSGQHLLAPEGPRRARRPAAAMAKSSWTPTVHGRLSRWLRRTPAGAGPGQSRRPPELLRAFPPAPRPYRLRWG